MRFVVIEFSPIGKLVLAFRCLCSGTPMLNARVCSILYLFHSRCRCGRSKAWFPPACNDWLPFAEHVVAVWIVNGTFSLCSHCPPTNDITDWWGGGARQPQAVICCTCLETVSHAVVLVFVCVCFVAWVCVFYDYFILSSHKIRFFRKRGEQ